MVPVSAKHGRDVVEIAAVWAVVAGDEVVEEVVDASLAHAGAEAAAGAAAAGWQNQIGIGMPCFSAYPVLTLLLFLGSLDGLAGLVAEDQLPLVPVSGTFFPQAGALSAGGNLFVALPTCIVSAYSNEPTTKEEGFTYSTFDSPTVAAVAGGSSTNDGR